MTPTSALQEALAAEHAALHLYGVLGARTSASADPALFDAVSQAYRRHRSRRDQLRVLINEAGETPVPAEIAYELPPGLGTAAGVRAAGLELEQSSAEGLTALIAQTTSDVRRWAATELVWSATWQLEFGGAAQTWPGAPELQT